MVKNSKLVSNQKEHQKDTKEFSKKAKGVDAYKYVGKINLKKDGLNIQRELRNESELSFQGESTI